ncbi:SGNH/GDSL hydrolase family protein [Kocuria salina]|uniref:SGNH/GDSL hydrolase family protein n=1 Tax=Kocuria salina TaxID=1929416 RepID=UPI0015939774|nr:SGNH/GDSL hydrolase family protein [Kocuria salina]
MPRNKKLANTAIVGLGALLVAGLGVAAVQDNQVQARNAAAVSTYSPPEHTVAPAAEGPDTALFIGDSYTAGAGVSRQADRWSTRVARAQGWDEKNLAAGGTGYGTSVDAPTSRDACGKGYCPDYAQALEGYVGQSPDVVVVAGGRNDFDMSPDEFADAVDGVLSSVVETFPKATVYAVSPVWDDDETPEGFDTRVDAVRTAAEKVDATFVDIGQPLEGKPDLVVEDGVHPNRAGHAALADAFKSAVRSA